MNWHDGKKTCEADGTKMVVPKSEEENSFIASLKPGQDSCSYKLPLGISPDFSEILNRF